jgi:hypothetical protein
VLTAKILSTIDVLSKGRLSVGVGAGWLREEFEAIGAPSAGFRRIDHRRNADHDEAVPRRGFGAGLTGASVFRCRVFKRCIRGVRVMRQLGRLGVWYPVDRLDGAGIRQLLRTVEELGYSTLW